MQVRRYDHLRWLVLRDMHSQLVQQGVIPPSEHLANPLCHTDYMLYSRGAPVPRNMTVVIAAGGNLNVLQTLVVQFCAIRFVHSILVLPKVSFLVLQRPAATASWCYGFLVLPKTRQHCSHLQLFMGSTPASLCNPADSCQPTAVSAISDEAVCAVVADSWPCHC